MYIIFVPVKEYRYGGGTENSQESVAAFCQIFFIRVENG